EEDTMARGIRFQTSLAGAATLLLLATAPLVAGAKVRKTGTSSTVFKVPGPAGLTIEGKTSEMTAVDDGTTVTITVPLGNGDTGISIRNEHTKKALETDKYPTTTLAVARSALKFPAPGAETSGDATGKMTLHGQARDVTFHYSAKNDGGTISVNGSTK